MLDQRPVHRHTRFCIILRPWRVHMHRVKLTLSFLRPLISQSFLPNVFYLRVLKPSWHERHDECWKRLFRRLTLLCISRHCFLLGTICIMRLLQNVDSLLPFFLILDIPLFCQQVPSNTFITPIRHSREQKLLTWYSRITDAIIPTCSVWLTNRPHAIVDHQKPRIVNTLPHLVPKTLSSSGCTTLFCPFFCLSVTDTFFSVVTEVMWFISFVHHRYFIETFTCNWWLSWSDTLHAFTHFTESWWHYLQN